MAKQYGQRLKLFYVADILKKYSDEQHPVTAEYICEKLEELGISAERKAVYKDISSLIDYGFDIVKSAYPRGWFMASREFEEPEIYLLADAVRAARFISAAKTKELISKLDSYLSIEQIRKREKRVYFDSYGKCANEEIYYNIDKISRAEEQKKKIEFDYVTRILSEDRTIKPNTRKMRISPYALVWKDDHYYLIGNYEKYDNLIHIRVDRMHSVEITDEPSRNFSEVSDYTDYFDASDYTNKLFSMHGGNLTEIELCCNKKIIEQVADRFSENIFIKNVTENEFSFSVEAALSEALVTWIINYGENIRVTAPQKLIEMVKKRADDILKLYS